MWPDDCFSLRRHGDGAKGRFEMFSYRDLVCMYVYFSAADCIWRQTPKKCSGWGARFSQKERESVCAHPSERDNC